MAETRKAIAAAARSLFEAHGYGEERPLEKDEKEEAHFLANRRVEFRIIDEDDTNKVKK